MKLIWIFISLGGFIGGYLPVLFGVEAFSAWGLLGSTVGSLVGIWLYTRLDI